MRGTIALLALWATAALAGEAPASLADAPPNTWVKALVTETGWREQPLFVYVPALKRFVMASGMQAYGGNVPRHYDTEELDLAHGASEAGVSFLPEEALDAIAHPVRGRGRRDWRDDEDD